MPLIYHLDFLALESQLEQCDNTFLSELRSNGPAAHAGKFLLDPPDILRRLDDADLILAAFRLHRNNVYLIRGRNRYAI